MSPDRAVSVLAEFANKVPLIGNDPFVTCITPGEGAGSTALRYISVMTASCKYGRTYIHTPFRKIGHVPHGHDPDEWSRNWDEFFNLGVDEIQDHPAKAFRWCYREVTGHDIEQIEWIFRDKYHDSQKPDTIWFSGDEWNVAMHVRRGDALLPQNCARVTDHNTLKKIISQVLPDCIDPQGKPLRLHIMSEGNPEDFAFLAAIRVPLALHLDECPFLTFHHLAMADSLILSKSNFSHVAGIMNPGQVFYQSYWHEPLPRWTVIA